MKGYRLRKLDKKGFTLVELSVVFVILTVVIMLTTTLILSGTDIFGTNAKMNTEKFVGDTVYNYVVEQLRSATHIEIADYSAQVDSGNALRTENGRLYVSANAGNYKDLYGDSFYGDYYIELSVVRSADNSSMLDISVWVYSAQGELKYTIGSSIKPLNIGLNGNSIELSAADSENFAVIYDYYGVASSGGTVSDEICELRYYSEYLGDLYRSYRDSLDAAQDSSEREKYAAAIRSSFNCTSTQPTSAQYCARVLDFCDGSWPLFDNNLLSSLAADGDSAHAALYSALNSVQLRVRTLYQIDDGAIVGTIYYVVVDGESDFAARLVYDTRTDDWFVYVRQSGSAFVSYDLSACADSASVSVTTLMKELESGTARGGGTWVKI